MDLNGGNSPSSPQQRHSQEIDYQLEQSSWSLSQLKRAAIQQRLLRPRSLCWAILLEALPPPNADIVTSLKSHRNFYNDLKTKLSMDPRAVVGDDPLSQNDESVWRQHFCDNELKALILQDVVRTFPDELYFRDQDVQDLMVRVLFFWARSHSIGYRQGMHEILAPALFELYLDRKLAPKDINEKLKFILCEDHLEHDSFMLFSAIMKGLERYYTTGDTVPSPCGTLPPSRLVHNPNEVVRYLDSIREEYLIPLDPELATHLANSNISMELFGIRWLRLLFGREFPRSELAHLWGFLFAAGPGLPDLHYVIIALLLSLKNTLMSADAGAVISALMRPAPVPAAHVLALALHLRSPLQHSRPPTPPPPAPPASPARAGRDKETEMEQVGREGPAADSGSEGVAEGGDVARDLAALALLRARLPPAAAALAAALAAPPAPAPAALKPLHTILQLAALLECRNHALIDVETALEAAEGQNTDRIGRKQLVPISVLTGKRANKQTNKFKQVKVKEVPLKVFHHAECNTSSDLPCLDPLRLRTE